MNREIHDPSSSREGLRVSAFGESGATRVRKLTRSTPRVRDHEDRVDVEPAIAYGPNETLHEHRSLSRACAGGDEHLAGRLDRCDLLLVHVRSILQIGREIAPRRARIALRVALDVALADTNREPVRGRLPIVDGVPERVLVEIVVLRVAGQRLAFAGPEQAASLALPGERPVDAAERLETDQVAQPSMYSGICRRNSLSISRAECAACPICSPARCRARQRDRRRCGRSSQSVRPSPRSRPRCSSCAARSLPNATSKRRGTSESSLTHSSCTTASRSRHSVESSSRVLHVGHLHALSLERLVEAGAHEPDRCVFDTRLEPFDAQLLRHAREELEERRVRDGTFQLGVDLCIDRARIEEPVDEPGGRAVGEALQLRDVERRLRAELLEHEGMRQLRRPPKRGHGTLEAPLPAVRARQRVCTGAVARSKLGERPQPLALGRSVLELPRERGQRPAARPAPDVIRVEDGLHFFPERARCRRAAVVGGRLADEIEAFERPCARGIEQVPVVEK